MVDVTMNDASIDSGSLSEIYLVVRPEERHAVEGALECILPPVHSTFQAVGRGRAGGLRYGKRSRWWPFGAPGPMAAFLPKTVFYLVAPTEAVDEILHAVGAALRAEGGPATHGLGSAFVLPIEGEIAIRGSRRVEQEAAE
jgi:nitrogen regulatory protein PII